MPQIAAPIEVEPLDRRNAPMCEACGVAMKLFGVEPHPTIDDSDLQTYVCPRCDDMQTAVDFKKRLRMQ